MGEGDLGTVPLFLSQENRSGSGERAQQVHSHRVPLYPLTNPLSSKSISGYSQGTERDGYMPAYDI